MLRLLVGFIGRQAFMPKMSPTIRLKSWHTNMWRFWSLASV